MFSLERSAATEGSPSIIEITILKTIKSGNLKQASGIFDFVLP
jgi:hypothetical protein